MKKYLWWIPHWATLKKWKFNECISNSLRRIEQKKYRFDLQKLRRKSESRIKVAVWNKKNTFYAFGGQLVKAKDIPSSHACRYIELFSFFILLFNFQNHKNSK